MVHNFRPSSTAWKRDSSGQLYLIEDEEGVMADQDPEIKIKLSELDAYIQEAVVATLRSMGIVKDPEETMAATVIDKEEAKGEEIGEIEKLQAQVDKLSELMKNHVKKDPVISSISSMPAIKLPPNFEMPKMEKFGGTGDPKAHLRHYVGMMRVSGLEEREVTQLFPLSLTGAALTWYYTLKDSEIGEWSVMATKFIEQYAYNTEMEVTRRELEETTQGERETFSAFVKRWRTKASKMLNRPSDEEQNKILLNCLNSRYYNAMYMMPVDEPFTKFYKLALQIEDGLKLATPSRND